MPHFIPIIWNKLIVRQWLKVKLRKVGSNFRIGYSSTVNSPGTISIGRDFFTGPYFYMSTNRSTEIEIGNYVMFGPDCKVLAGNHNMCWTGGHMMQAPGATNNLGITIEDGVWAGANALILDGAFVSEGSVLAAGSVVTNYIPPYVIAAGVPSKKFKARFSSKELEVVLKNVKSRYDMETIANIYAKHGVS